MISSFSIALFWQFVYPSFADEAPIPSYMQLVIGVAATTLVWIVVTIFTAPSDDKTLLRFYRKVQPGGPGWERMLDKAESDGENVEGLSTAWTVPSEILLMVIGCFAVYGALFATGFWVYGNIIPAIIATVLAISSGIILFRSWSKMKVQEGE